MPRQPGHRNEGAAWKCFRRNLALAIERRGITHKDLAIRIQRTTKGVQRWLSGEVAPHIDDIPKLARALRVSPGMLAFADEQAFLTALGVTTARSS